jgi:hypothetical protein
MLSILEESRWETGVVVNRVEAKWLQIGQETQRSIETTVSNNVKSVTCCWSDSSIEVRAHEVCDSAISTELEGTTSDSSFPFSSSSLLFTQPRRAVSLH